MLENPEPFQSPLRLGLLCNSHLQPLWIRKALAELLAARVIELPLIAVTEIPARHSWRRLFRAVADIWRVRSSWLYRLYRTADRLLARSKPDALALGRVADLCLSTEMITMRVRATDSGIQIDEGDVAIIASHNLDVLFCAGVSLEKCGELSLARYGTWYIEHEADPYESGPTKGFWEMMGGYPVLKFELKRHDTSLPRPQVLGRSFMPTHVREQLWPVHGARNLRLWVAATWLTRVLKRLHVAAFHALKEAPEMGPLEPTFLEMQQLPSNRKMIHVVLKKALHRFPSWVGAGEGFDAWRLGYQLGESVHRIFGLQSFTEMAPPNDLFWADPFPIKHGNKFFIFLEELPYSKNKGHISVIQMDEDGHWKPPVKILDRPYHLSYPCVFLWQGDYYMVPETSGNRTVELYKCSSFPFEWALVKILMEDVDGVDPTLIEIDGLWWMFLATMPYDVAKDDNYMELSLFHANSPLGPWTPHPGNPVKSDARNTRPAGRLFHANGHLYRPAQDCSRAYGYAVSINKVLKLNPEEFEETEVGKLTPSLIPNAGRIHTVNSWNGLTVVDWVRVS